MVTDFAPVLSVPNQNKVVALDATYSLFRASDDTNFYFNLLGQKEKWLEGKTNSFGNPWYLLLPDNTLREWNGTRSVGTSILASNLPPEAYASPLLLADAYADGGVLDSPIKLNPYGSGGGPGDHL